MSKEIKFTVSASPQITDNKNSTKKIMLDVLISLIPVSIASIIFFGYHVLINLILCVTFCFFTETIWSMAIRKKWNRDGFKTASSWDFSCIVTGVILALNLPTVMDVKDWSLNIVSQSGKILFSFETVILCFVGSVVAILLVKQLFGGIGRNFANPAATARVFLFITFGTAFLTSQTQGIGLDATTGATWLSSDTKANGTLLLNAFLGNVGTSAVGETCVIAILLGYVYLCFRKIIDYRIPLMIVGFTAIFALLFDGLIKNHLSGIELLYNILAHILCGGMLFGSVFMATDYASSPNTFVGNIIFCFGIALFTMLIRVFAGYPEGMSFAILIMNCATPLIDKLVYPKPFGFIKKQRQRGAK